MIEWLRGRHVELVTRTENPKYRYPPVKFPEFRNVKAATVGSAVVLIIIYRLVFVRVTLCNHSLFCDAGRYLTTSDTLHSNSFRMRDNFKARIDDHCLHYRLQVRQTNNQGDSDERAGGRRKRTRLVISRCRPAPAFVGQKVIWLWALWSS